MAFHVGARLGPYEIEATAGAGGMGEVYRARDTRLDRTVAIKVLHSHVASDAGARARFEREARMVSQLHHPHICALFDIGRHGNTDYLVLEYLDGETLARKLSAQHGRPMPFGDALTIAIQIAQALDHAHRRQLIHRDLKPGNVMLTRSGAKLLDFGLAKDGAARAVLQGRPDDLTAAADTPLTGEGSLVGTINYMAPEQLEGRDADQRTDIFAFGTLLYEMVAGRHAFEGRTQINLMAAILEHDPVPLAPADGSSGVISSALERIARTCLAKNPEERWQSMADVARQLSWIKEGRSLPADAPLVSPPATWRAWLPWAVAGIAIVIAAVTAAFALKPAASATAPRLRFNTTLPNVASPFLTMNLSPDGRYLVFRNREASGRSLLWVREMASGSDQIVPNSELGVMPAWSPDSQALAFFSAGSILRWDVGGGPARPLVDTSGDVYGLAWSDAGEVVFASPAGLSRIPDQGGTPTLIMKTDPAQGRANMAVPSLLPDGRRFLFLQGEFGGPRKICVGAFAGGEPECLDPPIGGYYYAGGRELFVIGADRRLLARRFDPVTARPMGDPIEVGQEVHLHALGIPGVTLSRTGMLAIAVAERQGSIDFVWAERSGVTRQRAIEPGPGADFDLSRDGRFVAVSGTGANGVYILDLVRGVRTRLRELPAGDVILSPTGREVAFVANRREIYVQNALGGEPRSVFTSTKALALEDWSVDGQYLAVGATGGGVREALRIPVDGKTPPDVMVARLPQQDEYRFSPTGTWLAYNAGESGRDEVYVSPIPATGERIQVSNSGGMSARWRDDGKELFYLRPDGMLMAVQMPVVNGRVEPSTPSPLFQTAIRPTYNTDHFAVGPGGQRFLLKLPLDQQSGVPVTFYVNWSLDQK